MGVTNKALLCAAGGAAVLAFVGVGANASFTGRAGATVQAGTGTVGVGLSFDHPRYVTEGGVAALAQGGTVWPSSQGGSPGTTPGDGDQLAPLTNMGSGFAAVLAMEVDNDGTLPLHSYTLSVSDPHAAPATSAAPPADRALADQTQVTVYDTAGPAGALAGTAAVLGRASLSAWEQGDPIDLAGRWGPLPAGTVHRLEIVLQAPAAGYTAPAEAGTLAVTFSVTGSDV